jgi:hypothetical protein
MFWDELVNEKRTALRREPDFIASWILFVRVNPRRGFIHLHTRAARIRRRCRDRYSRATDGKGVNDDATRRQCDVVLIRDFFPEESRRDG